MRNNIALSPYVVVIIALLTGIIIRFLLHPILSNNSPLLIFIISVIVSGWYGGFKPVLLATVLSIIMGYIFFTEPYFQLVHKGFDDLVRIGIFGLSGLLIGFITESRLRREREICRLLDKTVREKAKKDQALLYRDQFISVASHELKTPITTIQLIIQLIRTQFSRSHTSDENLIRYVSGMEDQIKRLSILIEDMLSASKIQSKRLTIQKEVTHLSDVISHIVSVFQLSHPDRTFEFISEFDGKVLCDKDKISQVVVNLLTNAHKYSPIEEKVIIRLTRQQRIVTISVQDFGIGIDPKFHRRIFNRFFRTEGKNESVFRGFGLGLFIAQEIIKKHKGEIWVESRPSQGSTFYVSLPIPVSRPKRIERKNVTKTVN